jgi:hypothetical protein
MLEGFRLTFPDGTTFRAQSESSVTPEQDIRFLFDGLNNILALFEQYVANGGQGGDTADGLGQGVFLGSGARIQTFDVQFTRAVSSDAPWGDIDTNVDPPPAPETFRDTLNRKVETTALDSDNPAVLEFGEYAAGADHKYGPKTVILSNLRFDPSLGQSSEVSGTLECIEASDAGQVIHGQQQTED